MLTRFGPAASRGLENQHKRMRKRRKIPDIREGSADPDSPAELPSLPRSFAALSHDPTLTLGSRDHGILTKAPGKTMNSFRASRLQRLLSGIVLIGELQQSYINIKRP